MPFLDSPTIRPLYDVHNGGPPLGFRCKLDANQLDNVVYHVDKNGRHCAKVTRTLRGMVQHQRMVHGIKQQAEFNFETVLPTREHNDL